MNAKKKALFKKYFKEVKEILDELVKHFNHSLTQDLAEVFGEMYDKKLFDIDVKEWSARDYYDIHTIKVYDVYWTFPDRGVLELEVSCSDARDSEPACGIEIVRKSPTANYIGKRLKQLDEDELCSLYDEFCAKGVLDVPPGIFITEPDYDYD